MSKSFGNTINLDETQDTLETKIRKTFLAPGDIQINPILGWYKALILPLSQGPKKFGEKEFAAYPELESAWAKKELSPQELKQAVIRDLAEILIN